MYIYDDEIWNKDLIYWFYLCNPTCTEKPIGDHHKQAAKTDNENL